MKSVMSVLKSRYFWISLGVVALSVLAFVFGRWMGWSMLTRSLIVIGLLVMFSALVVFELVRAQKSAQQIEQSIKMQAEQQRTSSRPDKQAEIEELQERLEQAIAKLKQSKLGRGRRGRNALHALPWYMFIGPPAAGKTTAIKNSGLNFPVGTDGVRGVGGTRNCDWFFTDQAILLDTAGRYMTEREDEEEWHAFLDMLKEHRSQRPINGVIIGISIEELVDSAPDEIEWHANTIRRRTSELVDRLGVRFPVYVVFTKCDLLQGFVEFFGDMTHQEREQIWGCTLTEEQREETNVRKVFEREFDRLYNSLVNARSERLSRSMKREERHRVYVFPLEFASAKDKLAHFVDQLFQPNPYQESPEFRGFYFTSGTQEGAPIDRVIQSMGQKFNLPSTFDSDYSSEKNDKSYFIKGLFTDVVIPDQYLVEQTSSSARRGRLVQVGAGVASLVLLVGFAILVVTGAIQSRSHLEDVEEAAKAAAVVNWNSNNVSTDVQRISELHQEISRLEQSEDDWLSFVGPLRLDRSGTVLPPARDLFYQKMRPLMRDQFRVLRQRVSQQGREHRCGSLSPDEQVTLRRNLKAYLLLSEEADRLREKSNRVFLRQHLIDTAMQRGPLARASHDGRGGQVESQVGAYVNGLARRHVQPFEARSSRVRSAQQCLFQKPTIDNIYERIKQEGIASLSPLELSDILQDAPGGTTQFANPPQVPGFFTKKGWQSFVKSRFEKESEDPGGDDWVIGQQAGSRNQAFESPSQITERLRRKYFQEYAATWRQFLRKIEYKPFGGSSATAQALRTIGDQYNSPLLYILGHVTNQTTFKNTRLDEVSQQAAEELEERARSKARSRLKTRGALRGEGNDSEAQMHPVNRRLASIHQLNADEAISGGASGKLIQSIGALQKAGNLVDRASNDPVRATEIAIQVLNENGGDLRTKLQLIQSNLSRLDPETRKKLFERPILEAWNAILQIAQRHLSRKWNERIYRPFQQHMEGRYPFDLESQQDAAIVHVRDFFNPQNGTIAVFQRDQLRPFLRGSRYRPKTWRGEGLEFGSRTVQMLKQVDEISSTLFSRGSLQLRFELQPDQPEVIRGTAMPNKVDMRIHGKSAPPYKLGFRARTEYRWPASPGAALSVHLRDDSPLQIEKEGQWAWFRMLEEADIEQRTPTNYNLRWRLSKRGRYAIDAKFTLYDERATNLYSSVNNFFQLNVPKSIN